MLSGEENPLADSNNHHNLDERLERLIARHEALAQSVELIAHMQAVNERHITTIVEMVSTQYKTAEILLGVAQSHERRITNLESDKQ